MDVLTDALRMMRVGRAHAARVEHAPPFGRRFPSFTGIGFHIGLQGTCWIVPDAGEPLRVAPGDVVLLPSGRAHAVLDSLATPVVDAPTALSNLTEVTEPETAARIEHGSTVLLCGAYLLRRTRAHPMFEDLPVAIHLTGQIGTRSPIGTLGDLLVEELERQAPEPMPPAPACSTYYWSRYCARGCTTRRTEPSADGPQRSTIAPPHQPCD